MQRSMDLELNETTVVSRAASSAFRELEGKMFIVGASSTKLVMLNDTATAVWRYLDDPRSLGQIANQIVQEFDVDREAALQDCRVFVETMAQRDLVRIGNQ